MNTFRNRWYWVGLILAVLLSLGLLIWHRQLSGFRTLLGISLITLFIHQFEEYQLPGYFPRMVNTVMFKSRNPDRFPLNPNTAWIVNVWLGWTVYISALVFARHAVWLAIASITISAGNVFVHALLFNIKGKTLYNPGMFTALVLLLPLTIYFFIFLDHKDLLQPSSLIAGLVLGLLINYFGILRLILALGKKDTPFAFKPFR